MAIHNLVATHNFLINYRALVSLMLRTVLSLTSKHPASDICLLIWRLIVGDSLALARKGRVGGE